MIYHIIFTTIKKASVNMKRKPCCIGLDEDVKGYLETRDDSAAEFINCLVRAYMEKEIIRDNVVKPQKQPPVEPDIVPTKFDLDDRAPCIEKIRAVILERPAAYLLPLSKNPEKLRPVLIKIRNVVSLNCEEKPTDDEITKVLREELKNYKAPEVKNGR